eukprot:1196136-Prorocentrum_minimum.AAC.1
MAATKCTASPPMLPPQCIIQFTRRPTSWRRLARASSSGRHLAEKASAAPRARGGSSRARSGWPWQLRWRAGDPSATRAFGATASPHPACARWSHASAYTSERGQSQGASSPSDSASSSAASASGRISTHSPGPSCPPSAEGGGAVAAEWDPGRPSATSRGSQKSRSTTGVRTKSYPTDCTVRSGYSTALATAPTGR